MMDHLKRHGLKLDVLIAGGIGYLLIFL